VLKAVYFDGDQTLWDFEALTRRSLAATMAQLLALRPETAGLDLDVESVVADREAVAEELRAPRRTSNEFAWLRSRGP